MTLALLLMLANCFLFASKQAPLPMELELSLGDSLARLKATATAPTCAAPEGEGHDDLVLGLGVRATKRDEQQNNLQATNKRDEQQNNLQATNKRDEQQNNQRTSTSTEPVVHQEEAVEGGDDDGKASCTPGVSPSCPADDLHPASAQAAGSVGSEVSSRLGGFDVNNTVEMEVEVEVPVTVRKVAVDHELASDPDEEDQYGSGGGHGRARKKLRLSKEQSSFLEDSFKARSTLSLEQKSKLARRLSLRPRQVEVWFQNRRARTKLKQTEVEREHLKRSCEALTQENQRLRREVAELRRAAQLRPTSSSLTYHHPLYCYGNSYYHYLPAAAAVDDDDYHSPSHIGGAAASRRRRPARHMWL